MDICSAKKRIYVLGSLNCDFTIRSPHFPSAGETVAGSDFLLTAGGKGANQAYACARLGGEVRMAGAVGKDTFGDLLLASLESAGTDVTHIRRGKNTGAAVIVVSDGENRIVIDAGANGEVRPSDADALLSDAREGDIFLTQLEIPIPTVGYALRLAKVKGMFTVLNPAPYHAGVGELVGACDLITPNEGELRALGGEEDLMKAAEKLLRFGAGGVIVTLGGDGSKYISKEEVFTAEARTFGKTVDTTAAGDTYCGALCVKLAEGAAISEAMRFASVCAGIAVTRRGAQASIPTRAEADALI